MPELPEVETVKRQLKKNIKAKKISKVWSDNKKMISNADFKEFKDFVINEEIIDIKRTGKNIFIELSGKKTLWLHLKMTGHLIYFAKDISRQRIKEIEQDKYNHYIHLIIYFSDGSRLKLSDLRKFARIKIFYKKIQTILKNRQKFGLDPIGKDPLLMSQKEFIEVFKNVKKPIKTALMDQALIGGIGNIYASEILFDAKVNPFAKTNDLSKKRLARIFLSTQKILKKAIQQRGTSVSDFRDVRGQKGSFGDFLQVYQRAGKECKQCGNIIIKKKQAQRSTFYCPKCQS
ncbi:MAG: bifunctional DNA-formamidopyrimidine glycosylase/DNA-(apurinic or apyrimidinic site) lyase [Candidatus Moranbacteria bacterium]|nr:bifunctional DNA-formamidopyrimidine glycosylase/DNA-(apurinic or apyrimidinic site) lyase [Candidatus Moranbacteria bacterium]